MPDITKGKWILVPQCPNDKPMHEIFAVDGSNTTPVALVEREQDANLLVKAPDLHILMKEIYRIYNEKTQCKLEDNSCAFMAALMAEEKTMRMIGQLLARIDSPELTHTQEYQAEIKPCPFCGGEAHLLPAYHGSHEVWRVQCSRCMAESMTNESPSTPIDYWNTRKATLKEN